MTRLGWMVVLGGILLVAVIGGLLIWWQTSGTPSVADTAVVATSTPEVTPGELSIYTSGQYGFSFFYPSGAVITDAYSTTTGSALSWRGQSIGSGTPIVRVKAQSGEMRIGTSNDRRELAACTTKGPAETKQDAETINGTIWSVSSFEKLGTDDAWSVTSYRTVRDGACVAVEIFEPLKVETPFAGYTVSDSISSFTFAS